MNPEGIIQPGGKEGAPAAGGRPALAPARGAGPQPLAGNLLAFALLTGGAFLHGPAFFGLSVALGGLLALANFGLLQRTLLKTLLPGGTSPLAALARVLFPLQPALPGHRLRALAFVRQGLAEPLGLLLGFVGGGGILDGHRRAPGAQALQGGRLGHGNIP